ncbi:MAG: hypothetical protein HYX94_05525 [Chloroflexi bacterium]|nr:hypothetical protein [Chloroflexota bacterium]
MDELIDKYTTTADPAQKKQIGLQAAVMGNNEYGGISLLETKTLFALSSRIGTYTPTAGIASLGQSLETLTHAK